MTHPLDQLSQQLHKRAAEGLSRRRRVVTRTEGAQVWLADRVGEPPLLSFCSNDYLGLATDPVFRERMLLAQDSAARSLGLGSGASHLVSGHTMAHEALEDRLAALQAQQIPRAQALSFATGYLANLAVLSALAGPTAGLKARVYADRLNHASLVEGALLSEQARRYRHLDLDHLRSLLEQDLSADRPHQPGPPACPLIVTDAVFSMDGDEADLPGLLALAQEFEGLLLVDDAHGFGLLGPNGQGSLAHQAVPMSERLIYMGTLGKAMGLAGAFVVAAPALIETLVQTARPYIYTTAASPAMAAAVCAALDWSTGPEAADRRAQLGRNIRTWQSLTAAQGHAALVSQTAIQPWLVGCSTAASRASAELESLGYWVPAIRPPTVPANTARLRISLSAAHRPEDLQGLAAALTQMSLKAQRSEVPR